VAIDEADQPGKRRLMQLAPIGNLLVIEKGIVMLGCRPNGIVLRGISLNNNLAP
jgi:hypothetical protein